VEMTPHLSTCRRLNSQHHPCRAAAKDFVPCSLSAQFIRTRSVGTRELSWLCSVVTEKVWRGCGSPRAWSESFACSICLTLFAWVQFHGGGDIHCGCAVSPAKQGTSQAQKKIIFFWESHRIWEWNVCMRDASTWTLQCQGQCPMSMSRSVGREGVP
jgi:hypothetical protein